MKRPYDLVGNKNTLDTQSKFRHNRFIGSRKVNEMDNSKALALALELVKKTMAVANHQASMGNYKEDHDTAKMLYNEMVDAQNNLWYTAVEVANNRR